MKPSRYSMIIHEFRIGHVGLFPVKESLKFLNTIWGLTLFGQPLLNYPHKEKFLVITLNFQPFSLVLPPHVAVKSYKFFITFIYVLGVVLRSH